MNTRTKFILLTGAALAALVLGVGVGSVAVAPGDIFALAAHRLAGVPLPQGLPPAYEAMVLDMRLPRVLLSFVTGAALAVCGAVLQSVLQNPLASPFGLGVSSGAGFGAAVVIVCGLAVGGLGMVLLPAVSLACALGTVALALWLAARLDRGFSNTTIILVGMVLSLFFSAVMQLLAATSPANAQRVQLWQLGSFSMKEWPAVWVVAAAAAAGVLLFCALARELDVMAFGEEQAQALGVDLAFVKRLLLGAAAVLTGTAVAFVGVIGFVDLIAPHVVRRLFGAAHRRVLPACALFGGTFLTLCDLAARTLVPGREIPIGSITALLGVPFFLYIFFAGRRGESAC